MGERNRRKMDKKLTDISENKNHMPSNNLAVETLRIHVTTWNVAGKSPHNGLNLDDLLQVHNMSDIYVLGYVFSRISFHNPQSETEKNTNLYHQMSYVIYEFLISFQEIVPLNAGNVLVMEDNGPAAKWLYLISQSLNQSENDYSLEKSISSFENSPLTGAQKLNSNGKSFSFQRTSLRKASKVFKAENYRKLKTCNCNFESEKKSIKDLCLFCQPSTVNETDIFSEGDEGSDSYVFPEINTPSNANKRKYSLIVSKQMVGIFVTIWVKRELVQHISHLRFSYIGRGIMGCLGNKGCISVSMSLHQTSFCFICSHLASGEKEGDEIRRNSDVIEILKNTQFPKLCRTANSKIPDKILDHERVVWLGDLNYRIALSYSETKKLLLEDNWDALLDKDQLKIERKAGRAFKGWKEGKIYFPPTYKYYHDSDKFYGESVKSKSKRRTPAWCDRILWHGHEIRQLYYGRRESRFSDHRPVCATFLVNATIT